MSAVNVRNLEQIREQEGVSPKLRIGTLLLASLTGAALVTAWMMGAERSRPPKTSDVDPLAALAERQAADASTPGEVSKDDVTFPSVLSDTNKPTTALAAIKDERGRLLPESRDAGSEAPPPPVELPGKPAPAGDLLRATSVSTDPKDPLARAAAAASRVPDDADIAPEGHDGGYQIQVASFRSAEDAGKFVDDLRQRGHRAYRQAAYVPDRGLWHRVRIGPFKTKFEATMYKNKLEREERILGFVVDPDKHKHPGADPDPDRESRLSSREKRSAKRPQP